MYNHADYRLMSRRAIEALQEYREVNLYLRGIVPLIGFKRAIVYYDRASRFAGGSRDQKYQRYDVENRDCCVRVFPTRAELHPIGGEDRPVLGSLVYRDSDFVRELWRPARRITG